MYRHDEFDEAFLRRRVAQFAAQVTRRLEGALTEDEFRPLRLMNGLYLQLHAYMLRVAIPYGTLDSRRMRQLALVAETWDKGYGHFTTRQNIQFNWPKLTDVPAILSALADVGMHSIQTSGNTVRNVTADHFAGAAADEIADPRPWAELLRQWSTDHPEFQFLPRKFKIAISGSAEDRAVTRVNDIGLRLRHGPDGGLGFEVSVGGGLGRTPLIARVVRDFLPESDLLPYVEAILGVYNTVGRRDNKHKARLKIALHEMGIDTLAGLIEARFAELRRQHGGPAPGVFARIRAAFAPPALRRASTAPHAAALARSAAYRDWAATSLAPHRDPGHAIVTVSLKPHGGTPGDVSAAQMRLLADLAERFGHDELRISHEQNVVLPHVHKADLPQVHAALAGAGLATANVGLVSDIVACPGMDYCTLATARSIPIAQAIGLRFRELGLEHEIGRVKIRISGCINACGHHHIGHVGILGLDRAGVETYQITLGGDGSGNAAIGEKAGPGFAHYEVVPAIERLMLAYLGLRCGAGESFIEAFRRLGPAPFRAALYEGEVARDAA